MNETQKTQRARALAISGGICWICDRPLRDGQMQGAHVIGNTIANRRKYGDLIIDHPLNIVYTCSLSCNGRADISNKPAECLEHCRQIYAYEARKLRGLEK